MNVADRLSTTVKPAAYRIRLEPDLDAATFEGAVEIDVELTERSGAIVLHTLELDLHDAVAILPDGTRRGAAITLHPEAERATLVFDPALPGGTAVLALEFSGVLNDHLVGFYRSTFTDVDGARRAIATTQLCETDARRAFPCFDEPAFKATFELTVVIPSHLRAFSNTAARATRALPDGRTEVAFAQTMVMSTYLVALVIGPFESTPVVDVDGVPLSVICTPGRSDLATFAQEAGAFALRYFSEYFGIPYPGDKVDLVAVPDFAAGAMENLGCITFRETLLLVDPKTASTGELQSVAMVVAHELAHMWFGDLVTMAWWEGIWLNEAFATHMQYRCTDAFRPTWQLWNRFANDRELGLETDGLHSTRSIEFPVHSPAEVAAMFDAITYRKGATVLRMLEEYLGEAGYREGVRRYLSDNAYANATSEDLWAAFEAATGEPVREIMNTWIHQGGHPVVTLADGTISQAPFSFQPPDGPSAIGRSWRVPVRARPLGGAQAVAQLLDDDPVRLAAATPAVVDAGGLGAYRTAYDGAAFAALLADLGALTELERGTLLADTWALVRAGVRPLDDVLAIAQRLGPVVEPRSWGVVLAVLDLLDRITDDTTRPLLQRAASSLLVPLLGAFGWDAVPGEDPRTGTVRAAAVEGLGLYARDGAVQREAAARFDAGEPSGDLAAAIVAVVAASGERAVADELLRRCRETADPQAQERYRLGLTRVANRDVGLDTFRGCFEWFRNQDACFVAGRLLQNRVAGPAVWETMAAEWEATLAHVPPAMQSHLVIGLPWLVGDAELAERIAAFHRSHPIAVQQEFVDRAVERMRNGVAFAQQARPVLGTALGSVA